MAFSENTALTKYKYEKKKRTNLMIFIVDGKYSIPFINHLPFYLCFCTVYCVYAFDDAHAHHQCNGEFRALYQ